MPQESERGGIRVGCRSEINRSRVKKVLRDACDVEFPASDSSRRCTAKHVAFATGRRFAIHRVSSDARRDEAALSEDSGERAAVDGDVLSGDEAGLRRTQERACRAKTFKIAETPGGNARDALGA